MVALAQRMRIQMINASLKIQGRSFKIKLILLCLFIVSCAAGGFLALLLSGGPGGLPIIPVLIAPGGRQLVVISSHPLVRFFSEPQVAVATPDNSKLYVTNLRRDSVSVIDVLTDRVTTEIPVGRAPSAIARTPDGSKAYVSNEGTLPAEPGNTVSVIDIETDTVIATVTVGLLPVAISITPDGSKAYVANSVSVTVSVISVSMEEVITTVPVGFGPLGLAITPDGSKLYVVNFGSIFEQGNKVSVIDVATDPSELDL